MPAFEVHGKGIRSGRKRVRHFRAIDEATAMEMAAKDGTTVERVKILPGEPASKELIDRAEACGLGLSDRPSRTEVIHSILVQAIHEGFPVRIRNGTAYNEDMEEVAWFGILQATGFQRSRQGMRVKGTVAPDGIYMVVGDGQLEGSRQILIDEIEDIWLITPATPNGQYDKKG